MRVACCSTVTVAAAVSDPDRAVICAAPSPTAVTSPSAVTVATASSLLCQVTSAAPVTALPPLSNLVSTSWTVSPIERNLGSSGLISIRVVACDTVTATCALRFPVRAVTCASPLPTALTRPVAFTEATAALLLVQLTGAPDITAPF